MQTLHDLPHTQTIRLTLNGQSIEREVQARTHLVDFLRDSAELKGSHLGCEHGVCGACTVQLDGQIVRGCLVLAVQAHGRSVNTVEGLSDSGQRQLSKLGSALAQDKLQNYPIHQFKPDDLRSADRWGYQVEDIVVTAHGLSVKLVPKP